MGKEKGKQVHVLKHAAKTVKLSGNLLSFPCGLAIIVHFQDPSQLWPWNLSVKDVHNL